MTSDQLAEAFVARPAPGRGNIGNDPVLKASRAVSAALRRLDPRLYKRLDQRAFRARRPDYDNLRLGRGPVGAWRALERDCACGVNFLPTGAQQRWCSERCRKGARKHVDPTNRTCPTCLSEFTAIGRKAYCGQRCWPCRVQYRANRRRAPLIFRAGA